MTNKDKFFCTVLLAAGTLILPMGIIMLKDAKKYEKQEKNATNICDKKDACMNKEANLYLGGYLGLVGASALATGAIGIILGRKR